MLQPVGVPGGGAGGEGRKRRRSASLKDIRESSTVSSVAWLANVTSTQLIVAHAFAASAESQTGAWSPATSVFCSITSGNALLTSVEQSLTIVREPLTVVEPALTTVE